MDSHGISYRGWLGARSLRFKEWIIMPSETVYVMGSAKRTDDKENDYKQMLVARIGELKKDKERMKAVDLNNKHKRLYEQYLARP